LGACLPIFCRLTGNCTDGSRGNRSDIKLTKMAFGHAEYLFPKEGYIISYSSIPSLRNEYFSMGKGSVLSEIINS
jgi:hypothetical protein